MSFLLLFFNSALQPFVVKESPTSRGIVTVSHSLQEVWKGPYAAVPPVSMLSVLIERK